MENIGAKNKNAGVGIFPGVWRETRFDRGLPEKGAAVPAVFGGHLREEQPP